MKVGDIIRRQNKYGVFVGQYIIITKITKNAVFGRYIDGKSIFHIYTENYNIVPCIKLKVSKEEFDRLNNGITMLSHHETKQWISASKERHYKLVLFYDNKGRHVLYSNCEFYRSCSFNKYKWNFFIKVYLENKLTYI